MTRSTSLRGLRTFCMAAKYESFRDAADKMFVTASAVSHQIKNLEDELGQRLFERNARFLHLTESGRALYNDISPLITQLDEAASKHRASTKRTELNISVQPFFASELFVPRLDEFTRDNPDIDINIDTSDESSARHPVIADVSIRVFKSPPKGLVSHRLFPLRLIPAGSPEFKSKLTVKKQEITSNFPLIVHDSRPKAWRRWEQESGTRLPQNSSSIRLDSMIAVARAAEKGLGAALVPVQLSDSWFDDGSLVPLFGTELLTDDAYYFVCSDEVADQPHISVLRDWVLQNFAEAA